MKKPDQAPETNAHGRTVIDGRDIHEIIFSSRDGIASVRVAPVDGKRKL